MYQFIKALEYLHSLGICHRDIKPHNLLYDPAMASIKLCDFGCSKRLLEGEPNIQYICARYYRAPEIVFGWQYYGCAIDLWSAGCVMMELFTGKPAFAGKNSIDQLARIVKVLGTPSGGDLASMGQAGTKFKLASTTAVGSGAAPNGLPPAGSSTSNGGAFDAPRKAKDLSTLLPPGCPLEALDLITQLLR